MSGQMVLVVGPSGAGKDTLINAARAALAGDERIVFVRRLVTRDAVDELEDAIAPAQFDLRKRCGGFALDWDAHGCRYGLPAAVIDAAMMVGRVVVANVSRTVVAQATEKYGHCHVLMVTAVPAVRAERLAQRGRETGEEIAARLEREGTPLPTGIFPAIIDNSGSLEDGVRRFVKELRRIAG